tara:strand:- start:91 stop:369 length:279 start_codon:yes stop_codon:yes gene_type:complete
MVLKNLRKSPRKDKKYAMDLIDHVTNKKIRTIHFGGIKKDGTPYSQYKDRTPLKLYSKYDNLDKEKRKNYLKRHKKSYGKYSADTLSKKYLW